MFCEGILERIFKNHLRKLGGVMYVLAVLGVLSFFLLGYRKTYFIKKAEFVSSDYTQLRLLLTDGKQFVSSGDREGRFPQGILSCGEIQKCKVDLRMDGFFMGENTGSAYIYFTKPDSMCVIGVKREK